MSRLVEIDSCDNCCQETENEAIRLCDACNDAGVRDFNPELLHALKVAYHSMERGDEAGSPARVGALHQAREAILGAGGEL